MGAWSREITKNNRALSDLTRVSEDNKNSIQSLTESFLSNADVIGKFTQVIKKSEQLQLKALAQGTTYKKFVDANTKAINGSMATQQEMTEALLTGFSQGLRNNTDELNSLLDEMIITGQNTKAMTLVMSNFGAVTGDSLDAQRDLVKITKNVGKTYGISSERLAESMANLQSQMEDYSIYGSDTVESLASIKTALVGMSGGKPAAERQIGILLKIIEPLNIAQQSLLGLENFSKELLEGSLTAEKARKYIIGADEAWKNKTEGNRLVAQSLSEVIGRKQLNALSITAGLMKKDYEMTSEMRKSAEDDKNTIANRQRSIDKFYQTLAPEIHEFVTKNLYGLVAGGLAARAAFRSQGLRGAASNLGGSSRALSVADPSVILGGKIKGRGMGRPGGMGGLLGKSAGLVGLLGGPLTIGLGVAFLIPTLIDLFKSDTKANKESAKTLKEMQMESKNTGFADRGVLMAARIASETVRNGIDPRTAQQQLQELRKLVEIARSNAANSTEGAKVR